MKYLTSIEVELIALLVLTALFFIFAKLSENSKSKFYAPAGIVIIAFGAFITCDVVLLLIECITL